MLMGMLMGHSVGQVSATFFWILSRLSMFIYLLCISFPLMFPSCPGLAFCVGREVAWVPGTSKCWGHFVGNPRKSIPRRVSWQFWVMSINQQDLTAEDHRLLLSTRKACWLFCICQGPPTRCKTSMELHRIHCRDILWPQDASSGSDFYAVQELNAIMSKSTDKSLELVELVWSLDAFGILWSSFPAHICCRIGTECSSFLYEDHSTEIIRHHPDPCCKVCWSILRYFEWVRW